MYKNMLQKTAEKNNKIKILEPACTKSPFSISIDIQEKDFKKLLELEITE